MKKETDSSTDRQISIQAVDRKLLDRPSETNTTRGLVIIKTSIICRQTHRQRNRKRETERERQTDKEKVNRERDLVKSNTYNAHIQRFMEKKQIN